MRSRRRIFIFALTILISMNNMPRAKACGPSTIEPIFVFVNSPDLPFDEFTRGKIGIVLPTFGRKTLVIAYRYLNGGSFTSEEQEALLQALEGKAPEDNPEPAIKSWIAARKEILAAGASLPEIYTERQYGGYDFFPNCTRNAFEVATATLKDHESVYGAADNGLRSWAAAQDQVFENCAGGAQIPDELGNGSPGWLRKDRDYQIAAAHFYSLNFDEARRRFEKIAADYDSPWQETANYLVARTLVRQASLADKGTRKGDLYQQAEVTLQSLMGRGPKFYKASQRLLSLVKYRLHPEDRLHELAHMLAAQNGNDSVRQDLIDYVWLIDKFETEARDAEAKRKEALKPAEEKKNLVAPFADQASKERYEALQSGQLMEMTLYFKKPDGTPDYGSRVQLDFKPDASSDEVLQAFEVKLGRKLSSDETGEIRENYSTALKEQQRQKSPNRKWESGAMSQYEGCYYDCEQLTLDMLPVFLRFDDLTDWILTLQTEDPQAYSHARSRWRETQSPAWLAAALTKAQATAPGITGLMRDAAQVGHDAPEFPTIAYQQARLDIAVGKVDDARKLLDEILSWQPGTLPGSARNQFVEQRARIASNLGEFLKFSQRKPVAFVRDGSPERISDMLRIEKSYWDPTYMKQTREEYEQEIDASYKNLLLWDDRLRFDETTADTFNWHVSTQVLVDAAHDPSLPDYLERSLMLAAWTRAILLKKDELALKIAPEVAKLAPEMALDLNAYLKAATAAERHYAALYVLLKFPELSPYIGSGLPNYGSAEESSYYFETAWWCQLPATDYNREGKEVPKTVGKPAFLGPGQLEEAQTERTALIAIGNGKSYLGQQVLEWAKAAPRDPRVPEALFIAIKANESYKYGCGGWESEDEIREQAAQMLQESYPQSIWTAKLIASDN